MIRPITKLNEPIVGQSDAVFASANALASERFKSKYSEKTVCILQSDSLSKTHNNYFGTTRSLNDVRIERICNWPIVNGWWTDADAAYAFPCQLLRLWAKYTNWSIGQSRSTAPQYWHNIVFLRSIFICFAHKFVRIWTTHQSLIVCEWVSVYIQSLSFAYTCRMPTAISENASKPSSPQRPTTHTHIERHVKWIFSLPSNIKWRQKRSCGLVVFGCCCCTTQRIPKLAVSKKGIAREYNVAHVHMGPVENDRISSI